MWQVKEFDRNSRTKWPIPFSSWISDPKDSSQRLDWEECGDEQKSRCMQSDDQYQDTKMKSRRFQPSWTSSPGALSPKHCRKCHSDICDFCFGVELPAALLVDAALLDVLVSIDTALNIYDSNPYIPPVVLTWELGRNYILHGINSNALLLRSTLKLQSELSTLSAFCTSDTVSDIDCRKMHGKSSLLKVVLSKNIVRWRSEQWWKREHWVAKNSGKLEIEH